MTTLTLTIKTWDSVRPGSVKKTGLGAAITAALKAMPGGDPKKLATPAACAKAEEALVSLIDTLTSAAAAVARAKDDKKDAAAQLKAWKTEAGKVRSELDDRYVALVEGPLDAVVSKWSGPRADLESKVLDISDEVRSIDQNIGHSEQMRQECAMNMIRRAGELRKQGKSGDAPEDFMSDKEFKQAYDAWDDMVEVVIKAAKKHEALKQQAAQLKRLIRTMQTEIEAAAKDAGSTLQSDAKGVKAFKDFQKDAVEFALEAASDGGRKYHTFSLMPDMQAAGEIRAEQVKKLAQSFKRLGSDDAAAYFDETMGAYGLSDKQLQKFVQTVRTAKSQVEKIADSLRSGGDPDPKLVGQVKTISGALSNKVKQLELGRTSKDIVQALSHNDAKKKQLDRVLDGVKAATKDIETIATEFA